MHDRITGKPFLDDEPVPICTKVIAFRLAAAIKIFVDNSSLNSSMRSRT